MAFTESERAALTQMRDTAPNLDRWRIRAHRLEVPERGSDLAIDDAIFPHMAISQLARMSLVPVGPRTYASDPEAEGDRTGDSRRSELPLAECCDTVRARAKIDAPLLLALSGAESNHSLLMTSLQPGERALIAISLKHWLKWVLT